jgi:hypothetical protein
MATRVRASSIGTVASPNRSTPVRSPRPRRAPARARSRRPRRCGARRSPGHRPPGRQVEAAVPTELVEHVVEERHAGVDVAGAGPVEVQVTVMVVSRVVRLTCAGAAGHDGSFSCRWGGDRRRLRLAEGEPGRAVIPHQRRPGGRGSRSTGAGSRTVRPAPRPVRPGRCRSPASVPTVTRTHPSSRGSGRSPGPAPRARAGRSNRSGTLVRTSRKFAADGNTSTSSRAAARPRPDRARRRSGGGARGRRPPAPARPSPATWVRASRW